MEAMYRYYKRKEIVLQCETVTPLFLGNADQEAEWRAAPFKSVFRYWWRVSQHQTPLTEMLAKEGEIFGCAGREENTLKSNFTLNVISKARNSREPIGLKLPKVIHPEYKNRDGSKEIEPLLYLANMGIMGNNGKVKHSYFKTDSIFALAMGYSEKHEPHIKAVLSLIQAFGTIGARCRNGWGSIKINNPFLEISEMVSEMEKITVDWKQGFQKDYPNCLGSDEKGFLIWKTNASKTWENVMKDLASTYIGIRTDSEAGMRLEPGNNQPAERHLLGVPLTNHPKNGAWPESWKNNGWKDNRHASPLRFIVHKNNNDYIGFILHLPFRFSRKMTIPNHIDQLHVWGKIHKKLDHYLQRATYGDCLS